MQRYFGKIGWVVHFELFNWSSTGIGLDWKIQPKYYVITLKLIAVVITFRKTV